MTPGTLADPTATLYGDAGGWLEWLAGNDNSRGFPGGAHLLEAIDQPAPTTSRLTDVPLRSPAKAHTS